MVQEAPGKREQQRGKMTNFIALLLQRARSIRYEDVSKARLQYKLFKVLVLLAVNLVDIYRITRRASGRILKTPEIFIDRYHVEDFSQTILYTSNNQSFADYPYRSSFGSVYEHKKVSLIATEKNESGNIRLWLESIFIQTRLPDELIIVDAGSTDGTLDLLKKLVSKSPITVKIFCVPNLNIAQGRNLAISKAVHPIIAVTDFGCRPEKEWLEKLISPFEQAEHIQASGGWYIAEDSFGKTVFRRAWPRIDQVHPSSFIPSSRSFAFTKNLWEKVGGYPEWLTFNRRRYLFCTGNSKIL